MVKKCRNKDMRENRTNSLKTERKGGCYFMRILIDIFMFRMGNILVYVRPSHKFADIHRKTRGRGALAQR